MFQHQFIDIPPLKVVTADNGVRHYTTPEGNVYESVTTFLGRHWDKSFLEKWKKRIGEAKADSESSRARDRGQLLHKAIETYLLNDEGYKQLLAKDLPTKVLFVKIKSELNKLNNIRSIEKSLYSDELKLAGTPDLIGDYNGLLSTVDFKGSTKEKLEKYITTYWLQTAIYSRMFQELYGELPLQSVIIMAVEDTPAPSVFIESTYKGQQRLEEFLEDPIKFQEKLNGSSK